MRFEETSISGVFVVDIEPRGDARGMFARAFCRREFADHGLVPEIAQMNLSQNAVAGTTRGLHYQSEDAPEAKFFRCINGRTFNVAVDVREGSETYGRWVGVHLDAASQRALYIPPLCAAGYQALTNNAEVLYTVSGFYAPAAERGIRYDDPRIGIDWPIDATVVSDKDRAWALL
jgi:dTDP-4-dehydrorhamnose 3,5-epimerase